MTNTDLSIVAMFAAQPIGVVKTGGLITGDGAFLAFLDQQTTIEQPNIQLFTGQSTAPPVPLPSPQDQLTDSKIQVAAAPIPPVDPEITMPAPMAKAEPIRAASIHDAENQPSLPTATPPAPAPAPLTGTTIQPLQAQPPKLAPPLNPAPSISQATSLTQAMPDKGATTQQVEGSVQASMESTPIVQPKGTAPLVPDDELEEPTQPIAHKDSANPIPLSQAPLSFDTTPTQAIISPAPHAVAPEAPLEPARKETPDSPATPSVVEKAKLVPLAYSPPTPAGNDGVTQPPLQAFTPTPPLRPVSAPPQPTTADLAPSKAALSVSRPIENTPDAGPSTIMPVKPVPISVHNQTIAMDADAEPEPTRQVSYPAPLPNPDVTVPQEKIMKDIRAPQSAALTLLEKVPVAKANTLNLGEAQPLTSVAAKAPIDYIAPDIVPQTTDQVAAPDTGSKAVKTDQAMQPSTIAPTKLIASNAPPPRPSEVKPQPPQNTKFSYQSHASNIIAPDTGSLLNAAAINPRNNVQTTTKPIPHTDAEVKTPTVLPNTEIKVLPTAIGASEMAQVRTIPNSMPKTQPAENAVPVGADNPVENTQEASVKNIPPSPEKQSTVTFPKAAALPPNDLIPLAADRAETVQAPEKTALYSNAFSQTGFSASIATSPAVQTPTVQPGPVPVSAIAEQIKTHAQTEKPSAIELTLTPEDLGKIRLYMASDGDKIRIFIHADRPETLELIRRNTESFSADLRQAGYSNASFSFSGSNGRQSTQQDRQNTKNGFDSATDDAVATATPKPTSSQIKPSGLNLRV